MNVSLYEAASAMNAHSRWQEMVAENLANSSIPGTLRQEISFSAVEAGLAANVRGSQFMIPVATTASNFSQGELTPTSSPTDLAIEGPAFFEVQMPNGEKAYTRNGRLQIDGQGRLVSQSGLVVSGESGPIRVDRNNFDPLSVSSTGEVRQGANVLGRLHLVEFNNPKWLTSMDGGCFAANDPRLVASSARASAVRQGAIENSNVSPVMEMASLVNAMRMFEANQRVLTMQDERMGKTIMELAGQS